MLPSGYPWESGGDLTNASCRVLAGYRACLERDSPQHARIKNAAEIHDDASRKRLDQRKKFDFERPVMKEDRRNFPVDTE